MRIAVLSDTHMPSPNDILQEAFRKHLIHMDLVLHCGDFTGESVWSFLNSHPRFFGVRGNMDQGAWAVELPFQRVVRTKTINIGLVHGFGCGAWERLAPDLFEPDLDLICFGHTHQRLWQTRQGEPSLLNPGSFSLPRRDQAGFAVIDSEKGQLSEPGWKKIE